MAESLMVWQAFRSFARVGAEGGQGILVQARHFDLAHGAAASSPSSTR